MNKKIDKQYNKMVLNESEVDPDPFVQFGIWFQDVVNSEIQFPNAFTLSTSTNSGVASSRMVLLKDFDERGFQFFTNSNSKKGKEISINPLASICFWWEIVERQIRIEGKIELLFDKEIDEYFKTRPRGSQIGAWASDQSSVIESREVLDRKFQEYEKEFEGKDIPRPHYWNGYRLVPNMFEFWQGRFDRLHDRLRYRLDNVKWIIERLAP